MRSLMKYGLFFFLMLFCVAKGKPQLVVSNEMAKNLVEKTALLTDREIYCVDEKIHFSAVNLSSSELKRVEWSNVLYVELMAPDGQVVTRRKYSYSKDGSTGSLTIPTGTLSGNYYLRAYTKWMRDYSPLNFYYKLVTVINPYRAELLEASGLKQTVQFTSGLIGYDSLSAKIETDKRSYSQKERASVIIKSEKAFADEYAVSVVPEGTEKKTSFNLVGAKDLKFSQDFIPETRGLSVSGKVVNDVDSLPMPYTLVGLTVFKDKPETRNVRTNEHGQFYFDLSKVEGDFEIFISAKATDDRTLLILVDNDYSAARVDLPYVPFDMSVASKAVYQQIAFVSQMKKYYMQQSIREEMKSSLVDTSFYGKPDFTVKLPDYIALPSVSEYFYELISSVRVKHEGTKSTFRVLGPYSELAVYEPLVLVDMVPIFDADKVLSLSPEKIERIEVVTSPYVRGDIVFGGIVSLFSKKGDLAGIDLPTTGRFINYSMLSPGKTDTDSSVSGEHVPSLNNCLYWNPSVKPDQTGEAKISFSTGDNTGNFLIIVSGFDSNGKEKVAIKKMVVN